MRRPFRRHEAASALIAPALMTITLYNRQRRVRVNLGWLRRFAWLALARCVEQSADGRFALRQRGEVDVVLVSDRVIARLHQEFMGIAGATDVITFEHGEVVISAETARSRAPEFGHSTEAEVALYIVHGLLHLNGFDDIAPHDAARMHRVQNRIWKACVAQLPSPGEEEK
jgi:probable rRNA maturation factor